MHMNVPRLSLAALASTCLAACGGRVASPAAEGTPSPATRSCVGPDSGPAFAASLVKDSGGAPTPVEAAQAFIRTGGVWSSPRDGWRVTNEDVNGATLVAESSSLHAVRLADATWAVDSGHRCT